MIAHVHGRPALGHQTFPIECTGPRCALSDSVGAGSLVVFSQSSAATAMLASTEVLSRGSLGPRRNRTDRRTRSRLRELCDEVLASYRLAQGQDILTAEDREAANQVLRGLTPKVAR